MKQKIIMVTTGLMLSCAALINAASRSEQPIKDDRETTKKSTYVTLQIAGVENNTREELALQDENKNVVIASQPQKIHPLKTSFYIPFISIIENFKEYKESAEGRAYVPKKALRVGIGKKKLFGIWENEIGIMLSPDPKMPTDDDRGPIKILDSINKQRPKDKKIILSVLKLLLLIDRQGNLTLENFEAFLPTNS